MSAVKGDPNHAFRLGVVVISIDTEQMWGHFDLMDESGFLSRYPYSLPVHDRLLNALCAADISATWTVVGALSLFGSAGQRDPRFAGLPEAWTARVRAGDESTTPLWYRRSFVNRLCQARPAQDIGVHGGLSHLMWDDPEITSEVASQELEAGIRALSELGIEPRALVFPRDLVAHLPVLARHGIRCYRGRAPVASEKLGMRHSLAGRVSRLGEELSRSIPPPVWPEEVLPGLWNIPASLSLYSMRPAAKRLVPLKTRVERVRSGIDAAACQRGIFHFWFHPENLAEAPWSFPTFEAILEEIVRKRDTGNIEILTMNQVVDRVSDGPVTSVKKRGRGILHNVPIVVTDSATRQERPSMRCEGLARFMELRGRQITEAAGVLWHSVEGRLYRSIPSEIEIDVDLGELDQMLRSSGALGAFFPSKNRSGLPSGLYVCRDRDYGFSSVQPRLRSKVRRGLERCQIRRVEQSELLEHGLQLNLDTMKRQGRYDAEFGEPDQWKRLVLAIGQSPTITPLGAFVDGRLAAFAITHREDGWLTILHQMSRTDQLDNYPNHAMDFEITQEIARDPDLDAVSFGTVGLVWGDGLHVYKQRLGYEVAPRSWVFQLHPAVGPVLTSRLMGQVVKGARRLRPHDQRLERISVVLEGARLSRQLPFPIDQLLDKQERTIP